MERLPPSAAALYWFLQANGETTYRNQRELAAAVGIAPDTLKDGLKTLRERGLIERDIKTLKAVAPA